MFVESFVLNYPFIKPIINSGNRSNFAGNSNRGLRYVHKELEDGAIVVNQDTVLPPLEAFKQVCGEGLVSPQQITLQEEGPFSKWDEYESMVPKELIRANHLKVTGFCLYISKAVMDKIGYIDEYFKAGFDDDDLCARACLAGFPVETVNIPVHHYVSKAGSNYQPNLVWNSLKFRNKWSIPLGTEHADFNKWITENLEWHEQMKVD